MKRQDENRSKIFLLRLKPAEFQLINDRFKKTKFRSLSEYTRSVLLEKPITILYRDKSSDDILEELILLRKELNFFGNNFNQTVRKLNSVSGMPEAKHWQSVLEVLRDQLEPSIRQIKDRINNYSDLWSQKLLAEKV
ncbi:plasmid mobilization relaxosome protein MobC [Pedobacter sp. SYSU D00535]|uniref:plasmid mobilization protein n=1 Tax=Pedobacter sp. SYSU D00535 TaxID=2810308 RepID=UPI001A97BED7|nr:plasmid mobilization relaxosome protein MobC [Pedobacter sp. SYSU D00535]